MAELRKNWRDSQPLMSDWLEDVGNSTICSQYGAIERETYGMVWDFLRYKFADNCSRKVFEDESRTYESNGFIDQGYYMLTKEENDSIPPAKHQLVLRKLADLAEKEYGEEMEGLVERCFTWDVIKFRDTGNIRNAAVWGPSYEEYRRVVIELFKQGVNWGRVIALFAFTAITIRHALERGKKEGCSEYTCVAPIALHLCHFLKRTVVHDWLLKRSWAELCDY